VVGLVERFREAEAPVVLVRVAFSLDGRDALQPEADAPMRRGPLPPDWSELVPEIGPRPHGDHQATLDLPTGPSEANRWRESGRASSPQ
jgi:hypothetical protein